MTARKFETREDHLEWLVTMASTKGWKQYAWGRAKELDSFLPGISRELAQRMNAMAAQNPAAEGNKDLHTRRDVAVQSRHTRNG